MHACNAWGTRNFNQYIYVLLFWLANYIVFDQSESSWNWVCRYRDKHLDSFSYYYCRCLFPCYFIIIFLPLCSLSSIFLAILSSLTLPISSNSLLIINYYKLMEQQFHQSSIFLVILSSLTLQISSNSLLIINYFKLMGTAIPQSSSIFCILSHPLFFDFSNLK